MKLTLSRALRHALLAAFALGCVPPAFALTHWWEDNFCYLGKDTSSVSTEDAPSSATELYFVPGEYNTAVGAIPTISTLTITKPYVINIENPYNYENFTNLTILNITLDTTGWADDDYVSLSIAKGNTVTLGDPTGASPSFLSANEDRYIIHVDGTLRMAANDFAANRYLFTSNGTGTVELTGGVMDLSYSSYFQQEGTFWNPLFLGASYHVNYTIAEDASVGVKMAVGYHGTVSNDEQYYINLTVTKVDATRVTDGTEQPTWYLTGDASMESLLTGDKYIDQNTGTYAVYSDGEGLHFCEDSSLSCTDAIYVLEGAISADDGIPVTLHLQGSTLVLNQGEGALNQQGAKEGLVIRGDADSSVILNNVSSTAPESIEVSAGTTLEINGPTTLTLDSDKNDFKATTNLRKGDGGTLIYIGGNNSRLNSLANTGGELHVQEQLQVADVQAATLRLNNAGDALTADTVLAGAVALGSGASLMVEDKLEATAISIDCDTEGTGDSGRVTIDGLTLLAHAAAEGDASGELSNVVLTATKLSSSATQNIDLQLTGKELELSLGDAANTTISSSVQALILRDSTLTQSSRVSHNGAKLSLIRTQHDASSTISALGTGVSVTLKDVTLAQGCSISVGADADTATVYTIPANGSSAMTLSGTATSTGLQLTQLTMNTHLDDGTYLLDAPGTYTLIESSNGSAISIENISTDIITAPGLLGTLVADTETGNLLFDIIDDTPNIIGALVTTKTSRRVADILLNHATATGGVLDKLFDHLRDTTVATESERREVLSALSGNYVAMLADSQRRGVANTISGLRNRIIQMGNVQGFEPETHVHGWIQADGAYNDIDRDGENTGYEYQSWGGTVGAHVDAGDFSFGAAISASYGDLTARSADRAEGNLDTISASIFIRHQSGPVTQMGILSFGSNELETERTVHTYKAEGEASGYTITAYYEAGYTFVLNEEGTHVLQPVVSAMLTAAHMGEFTETGTIGNAGFIGEEQDYFYGTVGIGARYQAVLGTDVNDRIAFFEARARVVADFGDDTHEATVSFTGAPGTTFTQYGAEVGKVGVQIGAGVSIPFGIYKTLFADVDADFRDCATSVSGSMGIRFEF